MLARSSGPSARLVQPKPRVRVVSIGRRDEHKATVWESPEFADCSLKKLVAEYKVNLGSRPNKLGELTPTTYLSSIASFVKSLEGNGDPLTLASITPASVE